MHVGIISGALAPKRSCFSNLVKDVASASPEAIPLKKRAATNNLMASKQTRLKWQNLAWQGATTNPGSQNISVRVAEYIQGGKPGSKYQVVASKQQSCIQRRRKQISKHAHPSEQGYCPSES